MSVKTADCLRSEATSFRGLANDEEAAKESRNAKKGLCEAIRYFLPWRTFNINDLLANLSGVGFGMLMLCISRRETRDAGRETMTSVLTLKM